VDFLAFFDSGEVTEDDDADLADVEVLGQAQRAVFEAKQSLTIWVSPSGGGTTSPAAGTYAYAKGDTVTVTVTAASGYTFVGWKLDGTSVSGTTITVTMTTAHTVEALFERIPYELYASGIIAVIAVIVAVYFAMRRRKPVTG